MRAITAASLTVVDGILVNKDTGRVIDYRSLRTNRRQEKKKSLKNVAVTIYNYHNSIVP